MAPEIVRLPRRTPEQTALLRLEGRSLYDWRVDIWALGIFAYELVFGRTPFEGARSSELSDAIQSQPVTFPSRGGHSDAAEAFIMASFSRSPLPPSSQPCVSPSLTAPSPPTAAHVPQISSLLPLCFRSGACSVTRSADRVRRSS